MKTTIVILVVLLMLVSGAFAYEYLTLQQQKTDLTTQLAASKSKNTSQATIIKGILNCANTTEKTYRDTKTYISVSTCIKNSLNVKSN